MGEREPFFFKIQYSKSFSVFFVFVFFVYSCGACWGVLPLVRNDSSNSLGRPPLASAFHKVEGTREEEKSALEPKNKVSFLSLLGVHCPRASVLLLRAVFSLFSLFLSLSLSRARHFLFLAALLSRLKAPLVNLYRSRTARALSYTRNTFFLSLSLFSLSPSLSLFFSLNPGC